jgi:CRP-like cAMP-binding protein
MALEDEINQLQSNPVFAAFDIEALRLIAFSSESRVLRKDDVLFREDDVSDAGYFILSGSLALSGSSGSETYGAGALVGETALFTETRRPATAVVLETTVVRRIPRHLMRRVLAEFPASAARVRSELHQKIASVTQKLNRIHAAFPDEV